jgi:hypothetical protein
MIENGVGHKKWDLSSMVDGPFVSLMPRSVARKRKKG